MVIAQIARLQLDESLSGLEHTLVVSLLGGGLSDEAVVGLSLLRGCELRRVELRYLL